MTQGQISFMLATIVALILLLTVVSFYQRYALRKRIAQEWGRLPKVTHFDKEESLQEGWQAYRQGSPTDEVVDAITWHDLDLIHIFELLNGTKSSVGAEALYRKLRTLNISSKQHTEFQQIIEFYKANDDQRQASQYQLALLGKKDKNLLWYYLTNPQQTQLGKSNLYCFLGALPLISLIGVVVSQSVYFVYLLIISVLVNFVLYQVKKQELERELACMSYLVNALSSGTSLAKINHPLQKELTELTQTLKTVQLFGFAFRVKSGSETEMLFEYVTVLFLLPLISYNVVLRQLSSKQKEAIRLLEIIGELDSGMAVLNFTKIMPYVSQPTFHSDLHLYSQGMYHPLLQEAVPNDVSWRRNTLVTGSNASGKSTYIKGIALNCILAQTIGYVCAESWQMKKGHVYSSMALEDDLFEGDSYFVAEIKSVNRIIKHVKTGATTYCFVDEILRGTNTVERIAASAAIVNWLNQYPSLAFVATHDIELSEILKESCENIHFSEKVTESDGIAFDYLVKAGPARTRNALKLLGIMDYPNEIVATAEVRAKYFDENHSWL